METEQAKDNIRRWMLGEGLSVEEVSRPDERFRLVIKDLRITTEVYQPANQPDVIVMLSSIGLGPDHKARVDAMDAKERDELLWDIRFRLIFMNVDFDGVDDPLVRIVITNRIFFDGLTKDNFMQRWQAMRRASIMLLWTINKRFGEQPRMVMPMTNRVQ